MTESPRTYPERTCPECRAEKHGNCNGDAWDQRLDQLGKCICAYNGHKPPPSEPWWDEQW